MDKASTFSLAEQLYSCAEQIKDTMPPSIPNNEKKHIFVHNLYFAVVYYIDAVLVDKKILPGASKERLVAMEESDRFSSEDCDVYTKFLSVLESSEFSSDYGCHIAEFAAKHFKEKSQTATALSEWVLVA